MKARKIAYNENSIKLYYLWLHLLNLRFHSLSNSSRVGICGPFVALILKQLLEEEEEAAAEDPAATSTLDFHPDLFPLPLRALADFSSL